MHRERERDRYLGGTPTLTLQSTTSVLNYIQANGNVAFKNSSLAFQLFIAVQQTTQIHSAVKTLPLHYVHRQV